MTASAVRFFLSAAITPKVQAASRWTAINAYNRKAFAVTGKDSGSPFLRFLAMGREAHPGHAQFHDASHALGIDELITAPGFLAWYRTFNYDYPFLDYSRPESRMIDGDLMAHYVASGPVPPVVTSHRSPGRPLVAGRLRIDSSAAQSPAEDLLAAWLRLAAGITNTRRGDHSTITFRTSPSGGARHPTDVGVRLSGRWPNGLVGSWWYDPLEHCLHAEPNGLVGLVDNSVTAAVFTLSSHVVRSMWRYRDVRAFRPVVIDAGHLIETLLTVITASGWEGSWYPSAGWADTGGELDPVFGYVVATQHADPPALATQHRRCLFDTGREEQLRTNPFISLSATVAGIVGENHLRCGSSVTLTPAMIDTLAHATPSSRQDRPTGVAYLLRECLPRSDLHTLVEYGLLLGVTSGDRLWQLARAWSLHDWFLSLLAHATEVAAQPEVSRAAATWRVASLSRDLPRALDLRRTCRSLCDAPLPDHTAQSLLTAIASPVDGIRVLLSTRHQLGMLEPGQYVVREGQCQFRSSDVPSEDAVTAAAAGQPWARQFSCIVWLIPAPRTIPGEWEAALVECGRVAQRIALAICSNPHIGVFQSPALLDNELDALLGIDAMTDGAYMIGIGIALDRPPAAAERRFQPSHLFSHTAC